MERRRPHHHAEAAVRLELGHDLVAGEHAAAEPGSALEQDEQRARPDLRRVVGWPAVARAAGLRVAPARDGALEEDDLDSTDFRDARP